MNIIQTIDYSELILIKKKNNFYSSLTFLLLLRPPVEVLLDTLQNIESKQTSTQHWN